MKEKNICCGYNKPSASGFSGAVSMYVNKEIFKCNATASLFENGKWYCKRHAPSKKEEREKKSYQNYLKRLFPNG